MKALAYVGRLEAWAQEELGAQRRLAALLEEQERALSSHRPAQLDDVTVRLVRELDGRDAREARRRALFQAVADLENAPRAEVTLGSIVERLGTRGRTLGRLRDELRRTVSETETRGRRLAAMARAHRQVMNDILLTALGCEDAEAAERGGSLVNAEV